jgi:predicted RNA binding protein YcfA (HicA-like mRNA interferase family)
LAAAIYEAVSGRMTQRGSARWAPSRSTQMSVLPVHGKQKELGTGLVKGIKKDLGLK